MARHPRTMLVWLLLALLSGTALAQRPQVIVEHEHRSFAITPPDSSASTATRIIDTAITGTGDFRVKLSADLRHLRRQVELLPQVRVADDDPYNVSIERQGDGLIALYHASGDRIAGGFEARSPALLLERVARLAQVQALVDLTYPRQHYELSLELEGGRGFLTSDQRFDITARADRSAILLLLNVDKTGTVSVLYPIHGAELRQNSSLRETFEVIPPYGTEYLKLFAFRQPPAGLNQWINRRIAAPDPDFDQLLRLLQEPGIEAAETRLKVVTGQAREQTSIE